VSAKQRCGERAREDSHQIGNGSHGQYQFPTFIRKRIYSYLYTPVASSFEKIQDIGLCFKGAGRKKTGTVVKRDNF
jgi:hypothetical protein